MRSTVFGVSPRVAKHASDKRATCPPSHVHVLRQEMFLLRARNLCVSLATNFVARYTVSEVAQVGDTEGKSINVARDMSPS